MYVILCCIFRTVVNLRFPGFFAYSSGCVIVVEDLNAGSQQHLIGLLLSLLFYLCIAVYNLSSWTLNPAILYCLLLCMLTDIDTPGSCLVGWSVSHCSEKAG